MAAYVLSTIAHEVAHMWFGDLVTMEWWNDLWLNEAFASWMDEVILHQMYPEFESDLILPQTAAFRIDQGTGVKAIRKETRTEADVTEGLSLPYVKGLTLLRMLESYVGAEKWQEGVRNYLEKFAWGNATEPDLWNEISAASGMDVGKIAGGYLNQPGFPLLTIDKDGGVSQERYLPYGLEAPDLQWTVPLNVKYKKDGKIKEVFYLLDGKTGVIDLPKGADWILPDAGAEGYFRWQIDIDQFHALVNDIASLENREKIALLDNSDALLRARKLSLEDYMFVLTRMLDEPHPMVLRPAIGKVITIGNTLVSDDNAAAFARFVDAELSDRFADVGIETRESDSEALIQLRPSLVFVLGRYGSDPAVRIAAAEKADLYLASADAVDSNLASIILRVTALNDDGDRYEKYVDAYLGSTDGRQKTNILRALVFKDPAIVIKALDFSISDAVMAGDASTILATYPTILDDHTILYEWLEANLDAFEAKTPSSVHQTLPLTMTGICNEKNLAMLREFFTDRDEKYTVSFDKQVENTSTCIARRERDSAALMEFLAQYDDR
jgi:alanyl aminopeptidase